MKHPKQTEHRFIFRQDEWSYILEAVNAASQEVSGIIRRWTAWWKEDKKFITGLIATLFLCLAIAGFKSLFDHVSFINYFVMTIFAVAAIIVSPFLLFGIYIVANILQAIINIVRYKE
jgi:hypothetical protein